MIDLQPDSSAWSATVRAKFAQLQTRLDVGQKTVLRFTNDAAAFHVKDTRQRSKINRGHVGLESAIISSNMPAPDHGVILGDVKTLDHLAIYWNAIEVGSDNPESALKLKGRLIYGFNGPQGIVAASPGRFRQDSDTARMGDAKKAGITPNEYRRVKNAIQPHRILDKTSKYLVSRFATEADNSFKQVFSGS